MPRRLIRCERGTTIVELLVALLVSGFVAAGALTVVTTLLSTSAKAQDRVDSTRQARLAVDAAIAPLASMTCLDAATPPLLPGSTARSVSFYDGRAGTTEAFAPTLARLTFDPAARTLVQDSYVPPAGTTAFPTAPTRTRQIGAGVTQVRGSDGTPVSVLRYYAYTADAAPVPTREIVPAASGLTADQVAQVVRVQVTLVAQPPRTSGDPRSTQLGGDAYVATMDPQFPAEGPRCAG